MGKFLVCFHVGDIEGRIEIYACSIQDARTLVEHMFDQRVRVGTIVVCD